MLQNDYILKMTQMMTVVIAKVLFNKEQKDYIKAEENIEEAAKSLAGIDLKLIKVLNAEDIINLIKTSNVFAGRCLMSAELLKEYGDILTEEGKPKESLSVYMKSLWLYIESILTKELPAPEDYYKRVDFLIENLSLLEFPEKLKFRIFEYFEFTGNYAKAEDMLFELIESGYSNIHVSGKAFYRQLSLKTDDELLNGNFSREEIEDGLEEIEQLINSES